MIKDYLNENETEILLEAQAPQFFMPSGMIEYSIEKSFLLPKIYSESDDESTKKGGLGEQVLGDQLKILEFLEMKHGWTTRGGFFLTLKPAHA